MSFSNTPKLTQAINSAAELSRNELLSTIRECYHLQNTHLQQSVIHKFINSCIIYKKVNTLTQLLRLVATRAVLNYSNIQMINFNDAFNFLLQQMYLMPLIPNFVTSMSPSNVVECLEILKLFVENNVDIPDKSIDLVVSSLISCKFYQQASEFLTIEVRVDRMMRLNIRDHIKSLLIHGETDHVFSILERLPINSISSVYIWGDVIRNICNSDKVHEFREFILTHTKRTLPNTLQGFEEIYSIYIKCLLDSGCTKEIMIMTLRDVAFSSLSIKPNVLAAALDYLLVKNVDIEFFKPILKEFSYMLTSDVFGSILAKLLEIKQFVECLSVIDLIINEPGFRFKFADINLSLNDFKTIAYLQNCIIRQEQSNETKHTTCDFEMLHPEKSTSESIENLSFEEVPVYLAKEPYEVL